MARVKRKKKKKAAFIKFSRCGKKKDVEFDGKCLFEYVSFVVFRIRLEKLMVENNFACVVQNNTGHKHSDSATIVQ